MSAFDSVRTSADSSPLDLPPVPPCVIDRFRNQVDTSGSIWRLIDPVDGGRLDWRVIPESELKILFQLWMCRCIERLSPKETRNQFSEILGALRLMDFKAHQLSDMNLNWWRELRQLHRQNNTEYLLHRVRAWFLWMADQEFEGFDGATLYAIEDWRIPGNIKGEAVSTKNKDKGPLSEIQFAVLIEAVRRPQPLTKGLIGTMLGVDLGANTRSLALLEERDLHVFIDPKTNGKSYLLDVPRIKKRLDQRATRRRKISPETGAALECLIAKNQAEWGGPDPRRPIFCGSNERSFHLAIDIDTERHALHDGCHKLQQSIASHWEQHNLKTPGQDDTSFRITPRRLRYTFATRLAIQGAAPAVIADLLDHTDLQHVMVYVEAAGSLSKVLTSAIGPAAKATFDRFLGKMVDRPEDAVPNDAGGHVMAQVSEGMRSPIGTCGCGSGCRLAAPYECYRCDHFQPWRNADHEGMLANIKRLKEARTADDRSSVIEDSFDEIIKAVEVVVELAHAKGQS